jgi:hypothetical protein
VYSYCIDNIGEEEEEGRGGREGVSLYRYCTDNIGGKEDVIRITFGRRRRLILYKYCTDNMRGGGWGGHPREVRGTFVHAPVRVAIHSKEGTCKG